MKTVLIVISRGIIVRNLLRNKCFEILKNTPNLRIVLLFNNIFNIDPPKYLEEEFRGENIIFEFVPNKVRPRGTRLLNSMTKFLVYTRSSWMVMQNKIEVVRNTPWVSAGIYILRGIYFILSKINFLKKIARWLAIHFFQNEDLSPYFEKYKPDLVFSTFILSTLDAEALKQAKRRGIKTIAMPKSWDNLDKLLFIVDPDMFLVQNETMAEQTKKYQAMNSKISVVGFSQFDRYKMENFLSKEEYCGKKGFDPQLPILFLGSEGKWSNGDEAVFRDIIIARDKGDIPSCNILMRPHFSNAYLNKYDIFKGIKNVFVDNNFRHSMFFTDHWDPSKEDYEEFVNSLFHCNIMITFASTLTLDASCFDKPLMLLNYGVRHGESEKTNMYFTGHYEQVIETGAALLAPTKEDVVSGINMYLKDPGIKRLERRILREKMCGPLDGRSGERIAENILNLLNK